MAKKIYITERKKQIIELVAEGKSNSEIAEQLTITIHTVKSHLVELFNKLGISSKCELVAWGFRNGILE